MTSCRSSRTTTAKEKSESRTEQTQERTYVNDVTYIHDSIFVLVAGDTVEKERWRTCWRDRIVHDTVIERVTDTVRLTETVDKVVEVPAKGNYTGWWVAGALFAIIVVYILIKILIKTYLKPIKTL